MKQTLIMLGCISLLSACVDVGANLDTQLSQEKDVIKTLEAFNNNYEIGYEDHCSVKRYSTAISLGRNKEAICCYSYTNQCNSPQGHMGDKCMQEALQDDCGMTQDDCKIYKRTNSYTSPICYFNYKKYLPEGVANNDKEFKELLARYNEDDPKCINWGWGDQKVECLGQTGFYKDAILSCKYNSDLTEAEREQCRIDAKERFLTWATSGGVAKKINQDTANAKIAQEKVAAARARYAVLANDCIQAAAKVKHAEQQNKSNGISLSGEKVVDFANNGIVIANDCSSVRAAGMMFGTLGTLAAMNCEEQWKFIHTTETNYTKGAKFKDKGLLYKRDGNYKYTTVMGAVNSIPAYRATQHKRLDTMHKTYLKDKSLQCCDKNGTYGVIISETYGDTCYDNKGKELCEPGINCLGLH
jgi:hypothetical protein